MLHVMETEAHPPIPATSLPVRLLADGRVVPSDGSAFQPRSTWRITRCWPYGGSDRCLVTVTIERRTYFATVTAVTMAQVERSDGVLVHVERFAKP
jgi:hypothetical protein